MPNSVLAVPADFDGFAQSLVNARNDAQQGGVTAADWAGIATASLALGVDAAQGLHADPGLLAEFSPIAGALANLGALAADINDLEPDNLHTAEQLALCAADILGILGNGLMLANPEIAVPIAIGGLLINAIAAYLKNHDNISQEISGLIRLMPKNVQNFLPSLRDPLILDLSGAGIQLSSVINSPAYFDFSNSGTQNQTGWVTAGEGILVMAPADGATVNASDLLGAISGSGFSDLKALDDNGDGVIDQNDASYAQLRVWVNSSGDGHSSATQLFTLNDLGIKSISLQNFGVNTDLNGNILKSQSTFTVVDGNNTYIRGLYEADLQINLQNVIQSAGPTSTISWEASLLPELDGFGFIQDLRISMSNDSALMQNVEFLISNSSAMSYSSFNEKFIEILLEWAGVLGNDPSARGPNIDARHMEFIYKFYGIDPATAPYYSLNPDGEAGAKYERLFYDLVQSFETRFSSQIVQSLANMGASAEDLLTSPYFSLAALRYNSANNQFDGNIIDAFRMAQILEPSDQSSADEYWDKVIPILQGLQWDVSDVRNPISGFPLAQLAIDAALAKFSPKNISKIMDNQAIVSYSGQGIYDYSTGLSVASSQDGSVSASVGTNSNAVGTYSVPPEVFQILNGKLFAPYLWYQVYRYEFETDVITGIGIDTVDTNYISTASGDTASSDSGSTLFLSLAPPYLSYNSQFVNVSVGSEVVSSQLVGTSNVLGGQLFSTDGEVQAQPFGYGVYTFRPGAGVNYLLAGTIGYLVMPDTLDTSNVRFEAYNKSKNLKVFFVDANGNPTGDSVTIADAFSRNGVTISKILLGDGTNIFPDGSVLSTWYGSADSPVLVGYNSGQNDFYVSSGTTSIKFGSAGGDRVLYSSNAGLLTIDPNGGTGSILFSAGVDAAKLIYQIDNPTGNLTLHFSDGMAVDPVNVITINNALTSYGVWGQSDAIKNIRFADGTSLTNLINLTSTWFSNTQGEVLTGSNWGGNTFNVGSNQTNIIFGNGSRPGVGLSSASNYNLVNYDLADGVLDIAVNGGGVGDINFGSNISARDILYQVDNSSGDLAILFADGEGYLAGNKILISSALTYYGVWGQSDAIQKLRFVDGAVSSDLINLTSTWFTNADGQNLIGSDWGANTFKVTAKNTSIIFGNGSKPGVGSSNSSNYNLVEYSLGAGTLTAYTNNGGIGDIRFGAGITAANLLFQIDSTNDLTIQLMDGSGNLTGDSITIAGAIYQYQGVKNYIQNLKFADGTTISDTVNLASTWFGNAANTSLVGTNWGANTFVLGTGGDTVTFGNGSARFGGANNYNLVKYTRGDGAAKVNLNNGGVGDIGFGAGITAADLLFQIDSANDLTIQLMDGNGNLTGDSITIAGAIYQYQGVKNYIQNLKFADGTTISNTGNLTSTWFGNASNTTLVGTNWGANTFVLGTGGDTVTFGNGSKSGTSSNYNLVKYTRGDGAAKVNLNNGGVGDIGFGAGITAANLLFQIDSANDLTIQLMDGSGNLTGDSITIAGAIYQYQGVKNYIQNLKFADGTTISDTVNLASTWFGNAANTSLVGTNWGANTFVLGTGGDTVTFGNGSARFGGANNYNLVKYTRGDGAAKVNLNNGGVGDIGFGAGITAADLLFQIDSANDLTIQLMDGNGNLTGDSITIAGAIYQYQGVKNYIQNLKFADGTTISNTGNLTSTWFGNASNTTLVGTNWGANTFVLGTGGDTVTFGNGSARFGGANNYNLVEYASGDGAAKVNLNNGGVGDIGFGAGITAADLLFQIDSANDLTIQLMDGNGNLTGDSITIAGAIYQYQGVKNYIQNLKFADGTTISNTGNLTSTWFGNASNTTLVGTNWGANTFVLGTGGDTVTFGNGSARFGGANNYNLVEYASGDGAAKVNLNNGGVGDIRFGTGITANSLVVLIDQNTRNVELALKDGNGVLTGDSIMLLGELHNGNGQGGYLRDFGALKFADGTSINLGGNYVSSTVGYVANLSGSSSTSETLDGSAGSLSVVGGSGGDTLIGGSGDILYGGAGADTFAFHAGFGPETIYNFTATGSQHDVLQFDSNIFSDWAHLLGATQQQGSDLLITLDANDTLLLKNVALANFTSTDAKFI